MRKTVGWKSELELELEENGVEFDISRTGAEGIELGYKFGEKEVELSVSRPGLKVPLGYKLGDGDVITLRIEQ